MPHANEQLLRDAYAAFDRGDTDAFFKLCTPDITFTVPGQNALSGHYPNGQAFMAALEPLEQLTGGTFQEEVTRIIANDTDGCVEVAQQVQRDGQLYRWSGVHLYRIRNGKLAEFREFVNDQMSFDRAWRKP